MFEIRRSAVKNRNVVDYVVYDPKTKRCLKTTEEKVIDVAKKGRLRGVSYESEYNELVMKGFDIGLIGAEHYQIDYVRAGITLVTVKGGNRVGSRNWFGENWYGVREKYDIMTYVDNHISDYPQNSAYNYDGEQKLMEYISKLEKNIDVRRGFMEVFRTGGTKHVGGKLYNSYSIITVGNVSINNYRNYIGDIYRLASSYNNINELNIQELFYSLNDVMFSGKIDRDVVVEWSTRMKKTVSSGKMVGDKNGDMQYRIALSVDYHKNNKKEIVGNILREMIYLVNKSRASNELFKVYEAYISSMGVDVEYWR